METFVPGKDLRSIIIDHLGEDQKSISKLAKELKDKGHDYHRLTLTGYLKALADLGHLKEINIPPAKVYSVPTHRRKNIYELLGEKIKDMDFGPRQGSQIVLYVLQRMFNRPVFLTELQMCGFGEPKGTKEVKGNERNEARAIASRGGLKIPTKDPAYQISKDYSGELTHVILELFLDLSDTRVLRMGPKQTTLEMGSGLLPKKL